MEENKNTQEGISDFYEYVNEDWEKEITLKDGEYVVSKLSMAKEIVEENLYNLISNFDKPELYDANSIEYKLSLLYNQLRDENTRNEQGITTISKYIDKINGVSTIEQLTELYSDIEISLLNPLIICTVDESTGKGTYETRVEAQDLYGLRCALSSEQINILNGKTKELLISCGYDEDKAVSMVENSTYINEIILSMYRQASYDYNMRGNGSLDSNTPNIPLRNILENLGYLDNRQTVYVDDNYLSM